MTASISQLVELMLAALTTGIILVLEAVLWRSPSSTKVRIAAGLFGFAVIIYVLCTTQIIGSLVSQVSWLRAPLAAFVSADLALYALLVTAVFEDKKRRGRALLFRSFLLHWATSY